MSGSGALPWLRRLRPQRPHRRQWPRLSDGRARIIAVWNGRSARERALILGLGLTAGVLLALVVARFVGDVLGLGLLVALVAVSAVLAVVVLRAYQQPAKLAGVLLTAALAVATLVGLIGPVLKPAAPSQAPATPTPLGTLAAGPSAGGPSVTPSPDRPLVTSYRVGNGDGSTDKVVVPGGKVRQPFQAASPILSHVTVVAGCNPGFEACPDNGGYFGMLKITLLDGSRPLVTRTARTHNNRDAEADLGNLSVQPGKWYTLQVENATGEYVGFYFRDRNGQAGAVVQGAHDPSDEGQLDKALAASVTGPPSG
jgi:hypothetical protein